MMKRAQSDNNLESENSQNDDNSSVGGGMNDQNTSGNSNSSRGNNKRFRSNEECLRLLIPSRVSIAEWTNSFICTSELRGDRRWLISIIIYR